MRITEQEIHAAADRLASEGKHPTLAAVRTEIGGGSYTTISEAMRGWKSNRQQQASVTRQPPPQAIADRMSEVATEVWGIAQGMAEERLQGERTALETTRREMELSQIEAAELADQLASELDEAKDRASAMAESLNIAQSQASEARIELAAASQKVAMLSARIDVLLAEKADALKAIADSQEKAEKAQIEAAELRGALNALRGKKPS